MEAKVSGYNFTTEEAVTFQLRNFDFGHGAHSLFV